MLKMLNLNFYILNSDPDLKELDVLNNIDSFSIAVQYGFIWKMRYKDLLKG